ncbi:hypothetical protein AVEN_41152-1 [Araneus ventricosus]|uniref:Uncharacterized protein n=1 Tax=Araneus ventricosus TaxID=182803 RepID=A0A4Y2MFV6_ARAVE|nr:hypothetical protein AVEN_41152-1 [Araneus ventricosus]
MISLAGQLSDNVKQIIYKVFSNNAYFAPPEHLLLSMLHVSRKHIRELAVWRILGARHKKTKNSGGLRFFKLPKLNSEAADYTDWSKYVVKEPPLTMHIKDQDLKEMSREEQFPVLSVEEYPCRTQSVERCVKVISEAAMNVCADCKKLIYLCQTNFKQGKNFQHFQQGTILLSNIIFNMHEILLYAI